MSNVVTGQVWNLFDAGFIPDQHGAVCLRSLFSLAVVHKNMSVSDGATLFRLHTQKKRAMPLKLHHWSKNSISEKCKYLNFKCWKPALIIYKLQILHPHFSY